MIVLGIETTTSIGSVALVKDGSVRYVALPGKMNHAEKIIPAIAEILRRCALEIQDIQRIAVSVGPGSFTGMRIGITVARTLAHVGGKMAVAVPTLDSVAYACSDRKEIICPLIRAIGGEVYYAFYRRHPLFEKISSYEVSDIKVLCAKVKRLKKEVFFVGEGLVYYQRQIMDLMKERALFAAKTFWQPSAKSIALMGAFLPECEWSQLSALYIRPSEAERKWKNKTYLLHP